MDNAFQLSKETLKTMVAHHEKVALVVAEVTRHIGDYSQSRGKLWSLLKARSARAELKKDIKLLDVIDTYVESGKIHDAAWNDYYSMVEGLRKDKPL